MILMIVLAVHRRAEAAVGHVVAQAALRALALPRCVPCSLPHRGNAAGTSPSCFPSCMFRAFSDSSCLKSVFASLACFVLRHRCLLPSVRCRLRMAACRRRSDSCYHAFRPATSCSDAPAGRNREIYQVMSLLSGEGRIGSSGALGSLGLSSVDHRLLAWLAVCAGCLFPTAALLVLGGWRLPSTLREESCLGEIRLVVLSRPRRPEQRQPAGERARAARHRKDHLLQGESC